MSSAAKSCSRTTTSGHETGILVICGERRYQESQSLLWGREGRRAASGHFDLWQHHYVTSSGESASQHWTEMFEGTDTGLRATFSIMQMTYLPSTFTSLFYKLIFPKTVFFFFKPNETSESEDAISWWPCILVEKKWLCHRKNMLM